MFLLRVVMNPDSNDGLGDPMNQEVKIQTTYTRPVSPQVVSTALRLAEARNLFIVCGLELRTIVRSDFSVERDGEICNER